MPVLSPYVAELMRTRQIWEESVRAKLQYVDASDIYVDSIIEAFAATSHEIRCQIVYQLIYQLGSQHESMNLVEFTRRNAFTPAFVDKAVFFSDVVYACTGSIYCMYIQVGDIIVSMQRHEAGIAEQQENIGRILQLKCLFDAKSALDRVYSILQRVRKIAPYVLDYKRLLARYQLGIAVKALRALKDEPLCQQLPTLRKMAEINDEQLSYMINNCISAKFKYFLAYSDLQLISDAQQLEIGLAPFLTAEFLKYLQNLAQFYVYSVSEFRYVVKKLLMSTAMLVSNAGFCTISLTKYYCYEITRVLNQTLQNALRAEYFTIAQFDDVDSIAKEQCAVELAVESCYQLLQTQFAWDLKVQNTQALYLVKRAFSALLEGALSRAVEYRVFYAYTYKNDVYVEPERPIYGAPLHVFTYSLDTTGLVAMAQEPHFIEYFVANICSSNVTEQDVPLLMTRSEFVGNFSALLRLILQCNSVCKSTPLVLLIYYMFDKLASFVAQHLLIQQGCNTFYLLYQLVAQKKDDKQVFYFLYRYKSFCYQYDASIERQCVVLAEVFEILMISNTLFAAYAYYGQLSSMVKQVSDNLASFLLVKQFNFGFLTYQFAGNTFYHSTDSQMLECQSSLVQTVTEQLAHFLKPLCLLQQSAFYHFLKTEFVVHFETAVAQGIATAARCTQIGRHIMLTDVECLIDTCELYRISVDGSFLRSLVTLWFSNDEAQIRGIYSRLVGWKKDSLRAMLLNYGSQLSRSQAREIVK